MKKKLFFLLLSFLFVLTFAVSAEKQAAFAEESYITISSAAELMEIGVEEEKPLDGKYILSEDIAFSDTDDFTPIGDSQNPFTGVFDGNGKQISNLSFDEEEIYNFGLFSHLSGASVTNLKLTDIKIENSGVFSTETTSSDRIIVGGLASVAENSLIENVQVSFDNSDEELLLAAGRVDFGGLLGRALFGTKIKNVFVNVNLNFNVDAEKLQNLNSGLVVGFLDSSKVQNTIAKGNINVQANSQEITRNPIINLGAIAGQVFGSSAEIISTYSDITFSLEQALMQYMNVGALVGALSDQLHNLPTKDNLSYNVLLAKVEKEDESIEEINQVFGEIGQYNKTTSVYNFLTKASFEIFKNNDVNKKYWSPYESYSWNTKSVWQLNASSLPSLQVFESYEVNLNINKTQVSLSALPNDLIIMYFNKDIQPEKITTDFEAEFKYGKKVEVVIMLINDYDVYFSLESVEINSETVIMLGENSTEYELVQYSQEDNLVQPAHPIEPRILPIFDGEDYTTTKIYLFSFVVSAYNSGDISVSLSPVNFDLEVKTEDEEKGMVRVRQTPLASANLLEKISFGGNYEYVAVPLNINFAFDRWVIEITDEFGFPQQIELEQAGQFSQINFKFGKEDATVITEKILEGGRLVALFTNNVTRVTVIVEESRQGENKDAGKIFNHDESQGFESSQIVGIKMGDDAIFVAKENQGYKFVGWYDGQNRLLGREKNIIYSTSAGQDAVTISAVFEKEGTAGPISNLLLIIGGIGVVVIGVVVVIVVRKRRDTSYRNFY